jgi:predicted nucleotidyltransferase/predicted XRE-type DNA-binding protein
VVSSQGLKPSASVETLGVADRLKVDLADKIAISLERQGLSVREAQARTGIAAADFSRLRNARLERFTIDRLIDIAARLGERLELSLRVVRAAKTGIDQPLLARNRKAIRALCRRFAVRRLGAFGSILRQDFDSTRSDVDLSVEFGKSRRYTLTDQYFEFKAALEQLLDRSVDLVELSAVPSSRLKRIIERTQVPVYDKAA